MADMSAYPYSFTNTATNQPVLKAAETSVSCGKVTYKGELAETVTAMAVTASYSECTAEVKGTKFSATVSPGSCKYEFSSLKVSHEVEGEPTEVKGDVSIGGSGCTSVNVEIPGVGCTFEIEKHSSYEDAVFTPDDEVTETTSEIPEAHTTLKGCGGGIGPPVTFDDVKKALSDLLVVVNAEFTFFAKPGAEGVFSANKPPTMRPTLQFAKEGGKIDVTITNPEKALILLYQKDKLTGGFVLKEIAGEKECRTGTIPGFGKFYLPKESCNVEIIAPCPKMKAKGVYEIRDLVFERGRLELEV